LCASRVARHASLLLLAALAGCAVPHVPSRTVYEDPTNFVRVELDPYVLPDKPETRHTHPAVIGTELMSDILRGFTVRERKTFVQVWFAGEASREPAFRDEEIAFLALQLSVGLSKAAPDERVTFYLSYPQTSIKREVTSGGLYVTGDELHFTLSNQREIYGIPAYGMVYDRRYPVLPIVPKDFDVFFEPESAVIVRTYSLWARMWGLDRDEIVIDLKRLPSAGATASVAP
jgi:hypothetical protein